MLRKYVARFKSLSRTYWKKTKQIKAWRMIDWWQSKCCKIMVKKKKKENNYVKRAHMRNGKNLYLLSSLDLMSKTLKAD